MGIKSIYSEEYAEVVTKTSKQYEEKLNVPIPSNDEINILLVTESCLMKNWIRLMRWDKQLIL